MIDIQYIPNLAEEDAYYLFPEYAGTDMKQFERIAVVSLRISRTGLEDVVNQDLEFPVLVKTALNILEQSNHLYAAFVELTPKKKSRLRSYKGLLYGLHKQVENASFFQKEIELSDGYSQFAGLLTLDDAIISFFVRHLMISQFFCGFVLPEKLHHYQSTEDFLERLYPFMMSDASSGEGKEAALISKLADWQLLMFRLMVDGQDQEYLEFYGRQERIESGILQFLLPRLKEHFYIRGERTGIANS